MGAVSEFDAAVLRGAALMDTYEQITGHAPTVEELIVDLLAWKDAGGDPSWN